MRPVGRKCRREGDRILRSSKALVPPGPPTGYVLYFFLFFTGSGPIRWIVTPVSFTGSTGLSPRTGARLIFDTTSCPSTTVPKIVYLPFHTLDRKSTRLNSSHLCI